MAASNTNALVYLGKYVSFNHDDIFEIYGVISNEISIWMALLKCQLVGMIFMSCLK
ncbi:hypothetical protein ACVP8M_18460 (plasmid) [Acinetobacter baumannii]